MTPGIPGAGIGGLFYVVSSLVLTVRHGVRRLRRRAGSDESRDVALLVVLAGGIALGVWLAGWLVGIVVSPDLLKVSRTGASAVVGGSMRVQNAVRIAAVLVGVGTLAAVMIAVELARMWQRRSSAGITEVVR